jgi:hypothetical protein
MFLDVIVDLPDSDESGAFETILVILKPGEQPQNVQTIIQKVKVVTEEILTLMMTTQINAVTN